MRAAACGAVAATTTVAVPADAGIDGRRRADAVRHLVPAGLRLAGLPASRGVREVVARPSARARRATRVASAPRPLLPAATFAGGEATPLEVPVAASAVALAPVRPPVRNLVRTERLVQGPVDVAIPRPRTPTVP